MDNNIFLKIYSRSVQGIMYFVSNMGNEKIPEVIQGQGTLSKVSEIIIESGHKKPMIFTDSYLSSIKIYSPLTDELGKNGIEYIIFDEVIPNPTTKIIEKSRDVYLENGCDMLIAIGGGSSMDTAKACGAILTRPDKTLKQLKGILKVGKKLPLLVCVPTTAGTGSEVTVAAIVTDKENNDKYAINDFNLIPDYAVLDPLLTINLPKHITSTTGMDALTHSIEAYIGRANTSKTIEYAEKSINLIFDNLYKCYTNGNDIEARQNMLIASMYGGLAFTRAYVGTVHAIAHAFGGYYGIPHGLANAIILPIVLEYYDNSVYKPLSKLAKLIGLKGNNQKDLSEQFIEKIKQMNIDMGIDKVFDLSLTDEEINKLVDHAFKEINPLYPVPKILSRKELFEICKKVTK